MSSCRKSCLVSFVMLQCMKYYMTYLVYLILEHLTELTA